MIELRIIGIIIGLIALYMTHLYYRRKVFRKLELLIWGIIWFGFIIIAITPKSFDFLLKAFQLSRTSDLIMIIAFIVIYILGFYNYITNLQIQEKLESLIRKEALRGLQQKSDGSNNIVELKDKPDSQVNKKDCN